MTRSLAVLVVVGCIGSAAFAGQVGPALPFEGIETLSVSGSVEIQSKGQVITVELTDSGRLFKVGTERPIFPPIAFDGQSVQVLYWKGHLAVIAPREGRAFHFSIPGLRERVELPSSDLDAVLKSQYDLLRIDTAKTILSIEGPFASRPPRNQPQATFRFKDDDMQDPSSGLSSCGRSCSMTCGDGSHCSISCGLGCASCTCPAACVCG